MKPVLIQLGPIVIRSWGFMVVLAFFVALFIVRRRAIEQDIKGDKIYNLAFYMLIVGLIGARLVYVLLDYSYYQAHLLEIFLIYKGGLAVHGAILGGVIATYLFCRYQGLSFIKVADIIAPALLLGQGIGRIGCFLTGICYGKVTDFFIRVKFPLLEGYRHPVQIYESILNLTAFVIILFFSEKFKKDGTLFATVIIIYSLIRFITDFVREGDILLLGMTYAQVASLVVIVVFAMGLKIFAVRNA